VRLLRSGLAPKLFQRVEGNADRVTTREMVQVADEDPHVRQALADAATAIGIAAANVVTVLHPDLVVLGGGVAGMGALLIDTVRQTIEQRVGMFPTGNVRVEPSMLGEQAGVVGAIALAMHSAASD
jgi:glucokinase